MYISADERRQRAMTRICLSVGPVARAPFIKDEPLTTDCTRETDFGHVADSVSADNRNPSCC